MLTKQQVEILKLYNQGLSLYRNRQFNEALALFQKALELNPADGPSEVYLERCKAYLENPPGSDWDGVFVMTTK